MIINSRTIFKKNFFFSFFLFFLDNSVVGIVLKKVTYYWVLIHTKKRGVIDWWPKHDCLLKIIAGLKKARRKIVSSWNFNLFHFNVCFVLIHNWVSEEGWVWCVTLRQREKSLANLVKTTFKGAYDFCSTTML